MQRTEIRRASDLQRLASQARQLPAGADDHRFAAAVEEAPTLAPTPPQGE